MSLVYITFHNENISDLERQSVIEEYFKFPKHISIHRKTVRDPPVNQTRRNGKTVITDSRRYSHKTMGYAETPVNNPKSFLKKNGGVKLERVCDHVCPPPRGLPPIPRRSEIQKNKEAKAKNFILKNVKNIKGAVPPICPEKYVDTVIGERHNLNETGLIPQYVLSKKFGQTPTYLKAMQTISCKRVDKQQMEYNINEDITELSDADRNMILMGLRANHSELEKSYQNQPIFTDTQSKKQRKGKLEQELKRLEQDILLIESNPIIYVCEN